MRISSLTYLPKKEEKAKIIVPNVYKPVKKINTGIKKRTQSFDTKMSYEGFI